MEIAENQLVFPGKCGVEWLHVDGSGLDSSSRQIQQIVRRIRNLILNFTIPRQIIKNEWNHKKYNHKIHVNMKK